MKVVPLVKCPICETEDNWLDLDYLRSREYWFNKGFVYEEPVGFKICKSCGFVTYDYRDEKELAEHYDRERPVMRHGNIVTCNRKNEYHKAFLKPHIDNVKTVIDIGCAQGSFLNMLNTTFRIGKDKLFGTEWSAGFRAFAKNEYGLNVKEKIEDFDDDCTGDMAREHPEDYCKKYDMICYYHVLEHIQHPEKELEKIKKYMHEDTLLYISVPVFFDTLEEPSGAPTQDFENLYHMNHVNVFSYQSLDNLLSKCGFKTVDDNNTYYGYTGLYKLGKVEDIVKEDYREIEDKLKKQKEVISMVNGTMPADRKPEDAVKIMPEFPEAYILSASSLAKQKDFEKSRSMIEDGLKVMHDNTKLLSQLGVLHMQWDENTPKDEVHVTNNIRKAEELFNKCIKLKSGDEQSYYFLGIIEGKYKKNYDKAVEYFKKVIKINPLKFNEMWDQISYFYKEKELNEKRD